MNRRNFAGVAAVVIGIISIFTLAFSQTTGPGGKSKSPGWFIGGSAPDPGGRLSVFPGGRVAADTGGRTGGPLASCTGDIAKYCTGQNGFGARSCLSKNTAKLSDGCRAALASMPAETLPPCSHSPVCDNRYGGGTRRDLQRVEWEQTMGFTYAYPMDLPVGGGGVSAVGITSKGEFWVFQRNAVGKPQLFEFDQNYKLIRAIGDDVIGHQDKPHGMAIDAHDHVWICDESGTTVEEVSPQGKLLKTIGVRGHRGDWN